MLWLKHESSIQEPVQRLHLFFFFFFFRAPSPFIFHLNLFIPGTFTPWRLGQTFCLNIHPLALEGEKMYMRI